MNKDHVQGGFVTGYHGSALEAMCAAENDGKKILTLIPAAATQSGSHFAFDSKWKVLRVWDNAANTWYRQNDYQWYALDILPFTAITIEADLTKTSDLRVDFQYVESTTREALGLSEKTG